MNEYTASLLRKQRLLAEEILNCKHSFRTPAMEMATATPKAPGGKAAAGSPQMLQTDGEPGVSGVPLFSDVPTSRPFDGKLAQNDDGTRQTAPMSLARRYETARQSVEISDAADAVRMRAISRYFQRDARRFREE